MKELIDYGWRPNKKTSNSLLALKYSQEQLNRIGKEFLKRYGGHELDNASSLFKQWVRHEAARGIKYVKPQSEIEQEEKREKDLKNKTKGSVKQSGSMSKQEVADWIAKRQQVTGE